MECPLCGTVMVRGEMWIYWRQWLTQVMWKTTDPNWDGVLRILSPGFIRRPRRLSYCCPKCEAFVIPPPTDGADGTDSMETQVTEAEEI
jgi:hypothetical protein